MPNSSYLTNDGGRNWSEIRKRLDERIGFAIDVYIGGKQKTKVRAKATPVKTFANFVLADVHISRHHTYRECFLYADFLTGEQPRNGIVKSV